VGLNRIYNERLLLAESRRLGSVFQRLLWRKLTFSIETSTAAMCPKATLKRLGWAAIFGVLTLGSFDRKRLRVIQINL
jgi:hypothetical protein